jgi:hypothetical protein
MRDLGASINATYGDAPGSHNPFTETVIFGSDPGVYPGVVLQKMYKYKCFQIVLAEREGFEPFCIRLASAEGRARIP